MNRRVRGSFTIEAAVIVPMILFIFIVLLHILFYWHDKNILTSTAHETVSYGSEAVEMTKVDLENYFSSRIRGKLLLFERITCLITLDKSNVTIEAQAQKGYMKVMTRCSMVLTKPEEYIRNHRKLEKIREEMVNKDENILQK